MIRASMLKGIGIRSTDHPRRISALIPFNIDALIMKPSPGLGTNHGLRTFLTCSTLCLAIAGFAPHAAAQQATQIGQPSNAQLADPGIEARVDRLLRQMTLEEKLGQLVQYNDTGDASPDQAAGGQAAAPQQNVIVAINPVTA